jgi:7-cyano-7-deazaguanine synthase
LRRERAVVLLSGGLDSATCLALAREAGYDLYALTLRYGQRHRVELSAARRIARRYRVKDHRVLRVPLDAFGGSALTDRSKRVHKGSLSKGIPSTYVPARNTVFLSLALSWCEALGARHLFIGVNALDYSGYPDCRPRFIRAFESLARLATKRGVEGKWGLKVHAPLLHMTKAQIVRKALALGVPIALTWSCYDPKGRRPCGKCDSCLLRMKGFREAGVEDIRNQDLGSEDRE